MSLCPSAYGTTKPTMTAAGERTVCPACGATWHIIPTGTIPRHEDPTRPSIWDRTNSKGTAA